jgi:carboxymethylenebutenolidase
MAEPAGTMIEFAANGDTAQGYLVQPGENTQRAAIIVIQEWWGLNDHIKAVADRFAAEGYVALAPDLYGGQATTEPDEARKLAMSLDMPQAVKQMVGAVNYLCGLPNIRRIGVVGFCMGGSLALLLSAKTPRVAAVVSFYGGRLPDESELREISDPLLLFYGDQDHGIPAEKIAAHREALERNNIVHEIVIYEGAGHAFFNDSRPAAYHVEAAADAWQRTLLFFDRHLQLR